MDKEKVLGRITEQGLVAVVRANDAKKARLIADACLAGGVAALEVTFTVPGAHRVIEQLREHYGEDALVLGAGTVLDAPTARIAMLSGAQYIISPHFDPETARMCNRYRVPYMPGVATAREVVQAMEAGADILKVFPASLYGPALIKSLLAPLPQAKLMPTGGVSADNAAQWIQAGAVALGAGSELTAGAKTGDYALITATAKRYIQNIARAREQLAQ